MAFPTVAATNSGNQASNATSHTCNLPASIASGDLLLIFFSNDGSATASATGWVADKNVVGPSSANNLTILRRVADGTEGSTVTVTTSGSEQSSHVSYRITNWAGTASDIEYSTGATGTDANPNPDSLNPATWDVKDTLWIACYGWDGNNSHTTYPALYSSNQVTDRAATAGGSGVAVATRTNAAASEDPGAGTIASADQWSAITVAVEPTSAITMTGAAGSYSLSGQAATLARSRIMAGAAGSYVITGQAATLAKGRNLVGVAGSYSLSGQAAALLRTRIMPAVAGAYTLSGQSASTLRGRLLVGVAGSYSLAGQSATLSVAGAGHPVARLTQQQWGLSGRRYSSFGGKNTGAYTMPAVAGSYALTGQAATLKRGLVLVGAAGSYALSGQSAALLRTRVMPAVAGAYALSGQAATLKRGYVLAGVAGVYTLSGQAATLSKTGTYVMAGAAGSYAITGQVATLRRSRIMPATAGSYTLSGQAATLNRGRTMAGVAGSYTLSGQAATLKRTYRLAANSGSYSLSGQSLGLLVGRALQAAAGSYALAGQAAVTRRSRVMSATAGAYALTGQAAALDYSGAIFAPGRELHAGGRLIQSRAKGAPLQLHAGARAIQLHAEET